MTREKAVIDACNVLYLASPREPPSIRHIFNVMAAVRASGREPIVVVDPEILCTIGEVDELQRLLLESCVISIPKGSDVVQAVLETAQMCDAIVVSNNTYVEYREKYPWVELCRLPVAIVDGKVRLLEARFQKVGYTA